jgi:hypothetical protein
MKNLFITSLLLLTMISTPSLSKEQLGNAPSIMTPAPMDKVEVEQLMLRLQEIKTMDKSHLTRSEKKILRKEVRASQQRASSTGGGVYVSVGALIIIILLLIILL